MGQVFLAEDLELERYVALKVLLKDVADDRERIARFIQEAKAASALNHPNIITIHEVGTVNDIRFIATEHIEGETLGRKIRDGTLTLQKILDISIQTSHALRTAHARNIIHRDIKPENIMVRHDGLVKVLDFGLAKLTQNKPFNSDSRSPTREYVKSRSGTILGTVSYMSPEQARGKKVDHRTDIFSLGSVTYEMLTGEKPFAGETSSDVIAGILMKEPKRPRDVNPDIPERLESITLKMLAKNREGRYQDIGFLLDDLERFKRDSEIGSIANGARFGRSVAGTKTRTFVPASDRTEQAETIVIDEIASTASSRPRFTERVTSAFRPGRVVPIGLGLVAILLVAYWLTSAGKGAPPNAEATALYNSGTEALRDGTYFKASKLLEEAINTDPNFVNAHARLAEAWVELDYFGRAEREMLKVRELQRNRAGFLSALTRADADLYIDAVSATVLRNLSEARRAYEALTRSNPDDAQAHLDLGRALEKNEEIDRAIESYEKASQLNGQYGAAFLRIGILKSRKGEYEASLAALDRAERIYERSSNDEGVAEVRFYRGVAFNAQDNLKAALEQFQQVASTPRANKYQKIRAMLQTSSLLCSEGKTQAAQALASEAIDLAREERMENVATAGLIDLANAFFTREEYTTAEQHLRQALDIARRDEGRRNEARASLALASLFLETHKPDQVFAYINQALPFYEQGGYAREMSQAYVIRGFASRMKGDLSQAIQAFEKASEIGEASQRALATTGLASVLADQEQYPKALRSFQESNALYESMGNSYYTAFSKYNVASTLAKLGLLQQANATLAEAENTLRELKISQPHLEMKLALLKARIALSEGRFGEVAGITRQIVVAHDPEVGIELYCVRALSQALTQPPSTDAVRTAQKAVELAVHANDPININRSKLILAEVYLQTGNLKEALATALEAKDYFVSTGQKESAWRAWLIAARSVDQNESGDLASQYLTAADESLAELKNAWGEQYFQTYSARADIKFYLIQFGT